VDFPKANITVRGRESDGRSGRFYSAWAKFVSFVPMSGLTRCLMADKEIWGGHVFSPKKAGDDVGLV